MSTVRGPSKMSSEAAVVIVMRKRTVSMMALKINHQTNLWMKSPAETTEDLLSTPLQAFVDGGHPFGQQSTAPDLQRKS